MTTNRFLSISLIFLLSTPIGLSISFAQPPSGSAGGGSQVRNKTSNGGPEFVKELIETRKKYVKSVDDGSGSSPSKPTPTPKPKVRPSSSPRADNPIRRLFTPVTPVPTPTSLPKAKATPKPEKPGGVESEPIESSDEQLNTSELNLGPIFSKQETVKDKPSVLPEGGIGSSPEGEVSSDTTPFGYPVPRRSLAAETPLSEDAKPDFDNGLAAFSEGRYEEARAFFEIANSKFPDHPVVLSNLGAACYRAGDTAKAVEYLAGAVARDLNSTTAWVTLGIIRFEAGDLPGAQAALAQAVYLDPANARGNNYLGVVMTRLGLYDAAEKYVARAIEEETDYAEAHFNLAVIYLQREPAAPELARRHYRRSLELGGAVDQGMENALKPAE